MSAAAPARRFGQSALLTPANLLTVARLLITIPVLFVLHDRGSSWLGTFGWFVVTASDGLDGYLARRDGTTRSGAFLDPIVDKVLVLGGLGVLAAHGDLAWWPFWVIGSRELSISAVRSVAGRRGISLPARKLGKYKTFAQFCAIGFVVLPPTADATVFHSVVVWVAVVLTVVSGIDIVLHASSPSESEPGTTSPERREAV